MFWVQGMKSSSRHLRCIECRSDENPGLRFRGSSCFHCLPRMKLCGTVCLMMTPMRTEGCGYGKTWCSCTSCSSNRCAWFFKEVCGSKRQSAWRSERWKYLWASWKLVVSATTVRKALKKIMLAFMSSLFTKVQSVESRTRCGGCSHILVKAVEDVAVSSYFGMVAGKNWGKIGPTLEWRPPCRRMRQESPNRGGSFSCGTKEIFNRVSQCVFALILEEHIAFVKLDSILTFLSSIAK